MFLLNTDTKFPSKIITNQNHTLNFIEIINKLSKVIGENLRLQKNHQPFCTTNALSKISWAHYHLQKPQRKESNPGINVSKEANYLSNEDWRCLRKELEEGTRRWEALPWSWILKINVEMSSYQNRCAYLVQCKVPGLSSQTNFELNVFRCLATPTSIQYCPCSKFVGLLLSL